MTYFHDIVSNAEILSTLISLDPGVLLHKSNQDFSIILVFNAESVLREKKKKRPSTTIPTTPPPADALGHEYVSALKRKVIKMQDLLVLETTERFEIRFTSNTSLKATQGNE